MQRADRAEKFLKGLSFWDKFKNRYRNVDFEQYKEFQLSDMMQSICMPTTKTKKCKNREIDDLYL